MTNLEKHGGEAWNFFISFCYCSDCCDCRLHKFKFKRGGIKDCFEAWKQEQFKEETK